MSSGLVEAHAPAEGASGAVRSRERRHRFALTSGAVLGVVGLLVLLGTRRAVTSDEPLFADPARSAVVGQGFTSPILRGLVPGVETRTMWQPPGYFVALAGWFRTVGDGLIEGRAFSAVGVAVAVLAVYGLTRRLTSPRLAVVAASLMLVAPWTLRAGTTIRPDAWAAAATAGVALCYLLRLDTGRRRYLVLTAVVAGLAVLIHPLGAIGATVVVLHSVLLRSMRWRELFLFVLIAAVVVAVPWGLYVLGHEETFLQQMGLQLARKHRFNPVFLLQAQRWHLAVHLLVVWCALVLVRARRRVPVHGELVGVWLVVAVVAATVGHEEQYPIFVVVAAAPVVALALEVVEGRQRLALGLAVLALVVGEAGGAAVSALRAEDVGTTIARQAGAVPPSTDVFLGQGASAIYFGLERSRVRTFSPVPVPVGVQAEVARRLGTVAGVRPPTFFPEIDALVVGRSPTVRVGEVDIWVLDPGAASPRAYPRAP